MKAVNEALAFPDGSVFLVVRIEILGERTTHSTMVANGPGVRIPLKVRRDEFTLRLTMPRAEIPLNVEGTLTVGERVLRTTISELRESGEDFVALAIGVREEYAAEA